MVEAVKVVEDVVGEEVTAVTVAMVVVVAAGGGHHLHEREDKLRLRGEEVDDGGVLGDGDGDRLGARADDLW